MRLEHLLSGVAVDVGFTDGDFKVRHEILSLFLRLLFSGSMFNMKSESSWGLWYDDPRCRPGT